MHAQAIAKDLDGVVIPVASLPRLIGMKRRAGRPRDLDDIGKLQQIPGEMGSE